MGGRMFTFIRHSRSLPDCPAAEWPEEDGKGRFSTLSLRSIGAAD